MKKLLSVLLLLALVAALVSCDLSKVGTNVDEELPPLELSCASPEYTVIYDKRDIPSFTVKADEVHGEVTYSWFVNRWENFGFVSNNAWADLMEARSWNKATFTPPEDLIQGINKGCLFRIQCYAVDHVEGYEDRHADCAFYLYLSDEQDPSNKLRAYAPGGNEVRTSLASGDYADEDYVTLRVEAEGASGSLTYRWFMATSSSYTDEYSEQYEYTEAYREVEGEQKLLMKPEGNTFTVLKSSYPLTECFLCVVSDGKYRAYVPFCVIYGDSQEVWIPIDDPNNGVWPEEVARFGLS